MFLRQYHWCCGDRFLLDGNKLRWDSEGRDVQIFVFQASIVSMVVTRTSNCSFVGVLGCKGRILGSVKSMDLEAPLNMAVSLWRHSKMSDFIINSDYRNKRFKIGIVCGVLLFLVIAPIVFLISVVHVFISVHEQGLSSNEEWLSSALEAIGWVGSVFLIVKI